MDEYKNKYPFNALRDMGYSDEMIDRCSFSLRWSFYDLIRNGLFNKERYKIFTRYYIDGCSIQDISEITGRSYNHTKHELSKIRHILQKNRLRIFPEGLKKSKDDEWIDEGWEELEDLEDDPGFCIPRPYENPYFVDIADMGLSVRAYNCLKRAGIETAGDIQAMGIYDLKNVRNLGRKSLEEILAVLKKRFDYSYDA